jgi:hypothetical protein
MTAKTYTHRDLAGHLGVSETTVKSYRSKFPGFLPVAREGKPVRLHPESLEVCRRIRDLFADGLSIAQASERLSFEFKEYHQNRRLSMPKKAEARGGPDCGLEARLEALLQAQEQARSRMEQLEAEVRNLATLEAASKSLVAELVQELRAARSATPASAEPRPEPTPAEPQAGPGPAPAPDASMQLTARKIVTVHGQAGALASYALDREPRPEPLFAAPAEPGADFLDLPAVILSDRGEFLGLPGGQSVARLLEVLTPQGGSPAVWFEDEAETWLCEIALGPALVRELQFERTTTPRGNLVGLILRLRTRSGSGLTEASPAEVQELFRQVRDQLG